MERLEVRGAPSYYACHEGVLSELEGLLLNNLLSKCLVIHGEKSWQAAEPFFPQMNGVKIGFERYNGECSLTEVERMATLVKEEQYQAVIGIGGGKVLDLAKAVAHSTNTEAIVIPTLASTCSAWTPLSVFYTKDGEFTHYKLFPKSTLIVLVEPRILLQSPIAFLRAGIADTLAKWYEADVLVRDLSELPLVVKIAHQSAKLCQIILLEYAIQAVEDAKAGKLSSAFLQVIETIIVAGGMVGGFGDRYGRIAAAHSVHNGLTAVRATHHLLHGEKVAYGILVQLALEKKWDEISYLLPFYQTLQLPILIEETRISREDIDLVSTLTVAAGESIHFIDRVFTATDVKESILQLEEFVTPLLS